MQINRSRIEPSQTTFKGIIPGREARCSGKITLDVVFGTPDNYRSEEVTFHITLSRADITPCSGGTPSPNSKRSHTMAI